MAGHAQPYERVIISPAKLLTRAHADLIVPVPRGGTHRAAPVRQCADLAAYAL